MLAHACAGLLSFLGLQAKVEFVKGKVVKALDEPLDPVQINEIARKLCVGKDWSYTYVAEREEEYIL